jgi:iron-sulfur cluster repair protein YtfE (RIC family)
MAAMGRPSDDGLEHDHAALTDALDALVEAKRSGADAQTIVEHAETLRDEFLDHFGDEEEHLFPELARLVPSASSELDELQQGHDGLCGLAVRIAVAAETAPAQVDALIERLESAYRMHARREIEVLRAAFAKLEPATRAELIARLR